MQINVIHVIFHVVRNRVELPVKMNHYCWSTERIPDRKAMPNWIFSM